MGVLRIWVRPGSDRESVAWDRWRRRWVVSCRAPAVGGAANLAVLHLLAGWLGADPAAVRWVHAGRSPAKLVEVAGIEENELAARLGRMSGAGSQESGST
jgi:uncharacterized protein YggU (UPF0235/DUF167 family)